MKSVDIRFVVLSVYFGSQNVISFFLASRRALLAKLSSRCQVAVAFG